MTSQAEFRLCFGRAEAQIHSRSRWPSEADCTSIFRWTSSGGLIWPAYRVIHTRNRKLLRDLAIRHFSHLLHGPTWWSVRAVRYHRASPGPER